LGKLGSPVHPSNAIGCLCIGTNACELATCFSSIRTWNGAPCPSWFVNPAGGPILITEMAVWARGASASVE
jgi:hypothetical protein